jgi:hypothetical protein
MSFRRQLCAAVSGFDQTAPVPCYHPITAYRSRVINASGKYSIVFNRNSGYTDREVKIPCGQCIGCRLERSRQWAIRCVHEASLHDDNCFVTLTYDNAHLPKDQGLVKDEFPRFIRRLRKQHPGTKIRYFHCGEYGSACRNCGEQERNCKCGSYLEGPGRPHYHAILFGYDFNDKEMYSNKNGYPLYISDELTRTWQRGLATVGTVTFDSCAYVARYVMKKIFKNQADKDKYHEDYSKRYFLQYHRIDPETGELYMIEPEFTTMSRRPGIAAGWYEKWKDEVYPSDFIVHEGKKMKPPRYYDNLFHQETKGTDSVGNEISDFQQTKNGRLAAGLANSADNTPDRLEVKEKVKKAAIRSLKRDLT